MGHETPYEVPPGQSRSTFLRMADFLASVEEKKGRALFAKEWPRFGLRHTPIYVVAHLESGISISALVEKDLAERLWGAEQKRAATVHQKEI